MTIQKHKTDRMIILGLADNNPSSSFRRRRRIQVDEVVTWQSRYMQAV
jgi:hypothetical protein